MSVAGDHIVYTRVIICQYGKIWSAWSEIIKSYENIIIQFRSCNRWRVTKVTQLMLANLSNLTKKGPFWQNPIYQFCKIDLVYKLRQSSAILSNYIKNINISAPPVKQELYTTFIACEFSQFSLRKESYEIMMILYIKKYVCVYFLLYSGIKKNMQISFVF